MYKENIFSFKNGELSVKRDLQGFWFMIYTLLVAFLLCFIALREKDWWITLLIYSIVATGLIIFFLNVFRAMKAQISIFSHDKVIYFKGMKEISAPLHDSKERPRVQVNVADSSILKFILHVNEVLVELLGHGTDTYLIAYLYYNGLLLEQENFKPDLFEVIKPLTRKTESILRTILRTISIVLMTLLWFVEGTLGYGLGVLILLFPNFYASGIGFSTGICIYKDKIALTNWKIGSVIFDIHDISKIENGVIYDVYGEAMTFEGIGGWRYKRLARILAKYLEEQKKQG